MERGGEYKQFYPTTTIVSVPVREGFFSTSVVYLTSSPFQVYLQGSALLIEHSGPDYCLLYLLLCKINSISLQYLTL